MTDSRTSQARAGRRRRGIAELGAARRPSPQRPDLAVAAHPQIAYHYDVGNELYHLMLHDTKSEAGIRTRSLRDAQLVLA